MSELVVVRGEDISKVYGSRSAPFVAVAPLDFELSSTARIGIVGESGSGKSTLSRLMVGLERTSSGTVSFNGAEMGRYVRSNHGRLDLRRNVQFVAQDTSSSFDPRRRLRDSVETPMRVLRQAGAREVADMVGTVLHLLQLDPRLLDRYPSQVSGGQRQRFALARALVVRPRILVCDEVVSALDVSVQGAVLNAVKEYCDAYEVGLAFVSHGLPATAFISDELVVMRGGRILERGPTAAVVSAPQHPYTASLLSAYTYSHQRPTPVAAR